MTTDTARAVLANPDAPLDERRDAELELTKSTVLGGLNSLIPAEDLRPVIDYIQNDIADNMMNKAMSKNIIPFPSKAAKAKNPGMQSVFLDDMQVSVMGDYFEKPGAFGFQSMRMMVDQTPILSAIVMTRIRQVEQFSRAQENGKGTGFEIRMRDKDAKAGPEEKASMQALTEFFTNCGWEKNPRNRARLKRDDFSAFLSKLTRDTLSMDSMPIETEFKRNRALGMDGMYAVDGATIRLCTEDGYRGDDEIRALQVVGGNVRSLYTFDDLIYVPRNPRTDVLVGGYGLSETELLIRTVTSLLNAMTYNSKFFDSNAIPKGLLHLSGNFDTNDLAAFKRNWNAQVKGINNSWAMPVMVSKDQESQAKFENFGVEVNEMMFEKWMTFLTSICCAIYSIGPDEINFEAFSSRAGGLSGNDTDEKLASSKDKGLIPLLRYFEKIFSDFIVAEFSDKYCFRFTGLVEEDEKQKFEEDKLVLTVNEIRARRGDEPITEAWGDAPVNPSLLGAWQAEQEAAQQDFGQPGGDGTATPADDGGDQPDFGDGDGGSDGTADFGGQPAPGQNPGPPPAEDPGMAKAFGLPVFKIEP